MRNLLIAMSAALLMGCQSEVEKRDMAGSDTRVVSSGNMASPTPAASTPVQSLPAPGAAATAYDSHGSVPGSTAYTESLGQEGMVDWTAGIVTASGIGYPPPDPLNSTHARLLARRAAQSVAYRNLLEAFKAIRVDSTTTVKNYVTTSDEIQVRVSGMVEDAKVIKERELEKGGYEVTLQMKLTGRVSETFAPKGAPPVKKLMPETSPALRPKSGGPYTGLVVDARGMNIRPAWSPKFSQRMVRRHILRAMC